MILTPIFWFFGLVAIIFLISLAIGSVIGMILLLKKFIKAPNSALKWIALSMMAITLIFTSAVSIIATPNIIRWMSELNVIDVHADPAIVAEFERTTIRNQFHPFADGTETATADFEPSLIITEDYPHLDGATAFFPVYSAVVETLYDGLDIGTVKDYVWLSTTRDAFQRLVRGNADIIFTLQPSQAQIDDADNFKVEYIMTPIFREAFVFFVSEDNPVMGLTTEQVQQIYMGEITNWKTVGGRNERILAYQRNPGSGSQTTMEQFVMDGLTMVSPPTELREDTMGTMLRALAQFTNNESALGYSFRFYATVMNPQEGLRMLAIDGVAPTPENITNGSYPFTVEIYAITTAKGLENPNTQAVIDWLVSPQGQRLIELTGYVGLTQ